ncbi:hypothetical protein [Anabaena sp. 4-3]|uniref:hypothetical protein n=1 Tax=Anabaena sp. 4-3 TaxID=1811979 RepID=UPI00083120A8|nr:hypothetical protein [Anabaena sp. 4-3]
MEESRIIYETLVGARVSDTHWWRVKKVMNSCELPLSKYGFELFLSLKKTSPRHFTQYHLVKGLINKQIEPLLGEGLSGEEFLKILEKVNVKPHQSTISRWFKPIGGYKATGFYSKSALLPIAITALIYKAKNQSSQLAKVS